MKKILDRIQESLDNLQSIVAEAAIVQDFNSFNSIELLRELNLSEEQISFPLIPFFQEIAEKKAILLALEMARGEGVRAVVERASEIAGIARETYQRKFHDYFGVTPNKY